MTAPHMGVRNELVTGLLHDQVTVVEPDPPRAPARPARRGRTARPARTIPSGGREFLRLLTDHGFQITTDTSRHRRVTHPDHPGAVVVIPSSPSDHRWALNTASQIRRTFGIDLRHAPRD